MAQRYVELVFDVPLDKSFTYKLDEAGKARPGVRAMASFGRRDILGYIIGTRDELPEGLEEKALKSIRRVVDAEPLFGEEQVTLARWMAAYYLCGVGEALAAMIPSGRREIAPPAFADAEIDTAAKGHELSKEQETALEAILVQTTALGAPAPMPYLYGITGSGKTEVFLRAAERLLAAGKSVIYLVPEIALTHQVVDAVSSRFGAISATLHSGMTGSARLAEWQRIKRGEARVVVGPRSAVFAPVANLGMIVIDEEHDGSYKSGNSPRYHARQVALKRCTLAGARLVMGSATPSVEAWKLMADGVLQRLDLSRRLSGGAPPDIRIVDMAGTDSCLSQDLRDEIRATAAAGRQTILFLNRRGFSYSYRCRTCGYELTCKSCSVSLTYHKNKGRAICHYCGYSVRPPTACPECASLDAGFVGFGTEMIEEEVRRTFPDLRVERVDADTAGQEAGNLPGVSQVADSSPVAGELADATANADSDTAAYASTDAGTGTVDSDAMELNGMAPASIPQKPPRVKKRNIKDVMDSFRAGKIDVLLGTQMVAKGLNFPGVRLVGVVLADTGLRLPDFRAAERTFSLIVQVAGRAGRYFPDGRVLVQTFRPGEPAITLACALDVEGFYEQELAQRDALGFPPYARLIRIVFRSKDAARTDRASRRFVSIMKNHLPAQAEALGPAECPIARISGNTRYQIIVRGAELGGIHAAVRKTNAEYLKEADKNVYLELDVDPVSLL